MRLLHICRLRRLPDFPKLILANEFLSILDCVWLHGCDRAYGAFYLVDNSDLLRDLRQGVPARALRHRLLMHQLAALKT